MRQPILARFAASRRVNTPLVRRCLSLGRRCRLVDAPALFVLREWRGGTHAYRLAEDRARTVVVRHGTRDIEILDEIFRPPPSYEPPAPAAVALRQISARRPVRVLDLGANIGLFAVDVFARIPGAAVTSYEPDPANNRVLAHCAELNGSPRWKQVEACALACNGSVRFTADQFADSHVADDGVAVEGVDVLPLLSSFDYVKMDIEGSEWPIIYDRRWPQAMRSVSVFVLEWHTRDCPVGDPREAAISAVAAAGFTVEASRPGWDHGMVWGWRSSQAGP